MNLERIGKVLLALGFLAFVGAAAWWYLFFEQVFGKDVKIARDCFYQTSDACAAGGKILEYMADIPPYDPIALWTACGLAALGVLALAAAPTDKD